MISRERTLAAINHQESDLVVVDLGATPSSGICEKRIWKRLYILGWRN